MSGRETAMPAQDGPVGAPALPDGETGGKRIRLRPRLAAAAEMLAGAHIVADVGCDHGRLCCALVQRTPGMRCIGIDVSAPSLEKARQLATLTETADRTAFRCGDGLSPLSAGEADAVALCGMGGILIARLLDACPVPLMGARLAVFQPMRGEEALRRYLYEHGWRIRDDRVIADAGRLYQVFSAEPGAAGAARQAWPAGFPEGCFSVGYRAFMQRDPLLPALARQRLMQHEKRLRTAQGTRGAALLESQALEMRMILKGCRDDAAT